MRFAVNRVPFDLRSLVPFVSGLAVCATLILGGPLAPARASSSCPNELFRTGPGANLPDCRAYEMVSPQEKNGGEVDGGPRFSSLPAPEQAAANGEAVTYASQTTFTETDPLGSPVSEQYLSRRGPSGWQTQAITPKQDMPGGVFDKNFGSEEFTLFQGFSEDLAHGFLVADEPAPVAGAPAGYFNPYLRNDADGAYQLLSTVTPPVASPGPADHLGEGAFLVEYAGMSSDGSRVVFAASDALLPGALAQGSGVLGYTPNLYEWREGQLELISEIGGKAVTGAFGLSTGTQETGNINQNYRHIISSDGSRVIWTDLEDPSRPQLYVHELTAGGARTVHVSASQKTNGAGPGGTDPAGLQPANYVTASADGGEVFFTSCEKLTNDSTAAVLGTCARGEATAGRENLGEDLYRYDAHTGGLSDLSVDPMAGQTASVVGVLGASEDGSSIYFVARGALVQGASVEPSAYNIYLWHDGVLSLVAADGSEDQSVGGAGAAYGSFIDSDYLFEFGFTRVSPGGRYLTFESTEPLTGYDNKPARAGACEKVGGLVVGGIYEDKTGRCIEVYEYDADTGRLTCASCNPRGLPPAGDSIVPLAVHKIEPLPGWQSSTVQQRYLLDDGRLFFDSTDALLPQASNSGKFNVYEYEPQGVGSCQRAGGCLALISAGTSSDNSYFIDASASGDDVFFVTREQLVAQDGDEALDLYDARVGGGFSVATLPPCGGEACRPPVASAPAIYGAPPSATFAGPGNPQPAAAQPPAAKRKAKPKHKSKRKHRPAQRRRQGRKGPRRARAPQSSRGGRG